MLIFISLGVKLLKNTQYTAVDLHCETIYSVLKYISALSWLCFADGRCRDFRLLESYRTLPPSEKLFT